MAETQANRHIMDAIETTPPPLMPLRDNKMLMPYQSPHLAAYPDYSQRKSGWWFGLVEHRSRVADRCRLQQECYFKQ
jgi:hypothetical protein